MTRILSLLLALMVAIAPASAQISGQIAPNQFLAGPPSGATYGEPAPRGIVAADLPAGIAFLATLNAKSANYTIQTSDCGKIVQETLGPWLVTLPAPAGFSEGCTVGVINGNALRAHRLTGFPAYTPTFLYSGQLEAVKIVNGAWAVVLQPGRFKVTTSTTIFVNQSSGSDTLNDGLDVTAPKQTAQQCLYTISNDLDFFTNVASIPLVTCKLGANDTTGVHFGPQGLSGAAAGGASTLDGNGFSIANSGDTDDAIHLFFGAVLYITNLTIIAGPNNHSGLSLEHGANAFIKANDVFTGTTQNTNHIIVRDGAAVELDNNYSISGPAFAHAFCTNGGTIRAPAAITASVTTNINVVDTILATAGGVCDFSNVTFGGAGSVTGQRFQANNAIILSKSSTPQTSIPGSAAGTAANAGSTDTVMSTTVAQGGTGVSNGMTTMGQAIGAAINFNATADIALTITLPVGFNKYRLQTLNIYNCSAAIGTAQFGIFTATGGGGFAAVPLTTGTITATGPAVVNSLQAVAAAPSWMSQTAIFFRVAVPQGSAVTCAADIALLPLAN